MIEAKRPADGNTGAASATTLVTRVASAALIM